MKAWKKGWKKYKYPFMFIAPTILLLFCFSLIPIVIALVISFTNMNLKGLADYSNIRIEGFKNYEKLFLDPVFIRLRSILRFT